jgi:porin
VGPVEVLVLDVFLPTRDLMKKALLASAAVLIFALPATFCVAQADEPTAQTGDQPAEPLGLFERDTLTGDWGGLRTQLVDHGVTLGLKYTGEMWAAASGGIHNGVDYEDLFLPTVDFDFEKMAGLTGGTAHFSALSLQGRGPSFNDVGNALDVSSAEYLGKNQRYTRLWEAWYQQTALDNLISLRAGQLSLDTEFLVSPTAGGLMNTTFGAPAMWTANLSAGSPNSQGLANGPFYPLSAPGARVTFAPTDEVQWMTAAVTSQPESPDRGGAQFKFDGQALVISEFDYLLNQAKDATGLPSMYKLGFWYDTANYADFRYDTTGRLLNLAGSNGLPSQHDGIWNIYGLIDQTVWKNDAGQAISVFLRGGVSPNYAMISRYVDGGFGYKGLIPGRENDVVTVGFAYAAVGDSVHKHDLDVQRANGVSTPVRDAESAIELSYTIQVAPWWTVQPDFQYIVSPQYGAANPNPSVNPVNLPATKAINDATVFGLRTTIAF